MNAGQLIVDWQKQSMKVWSDVFVRTGCSDQADAALEKFVSKFPKPGLVTGSGVVYSQWLEILSRDHAIFADTFNLTRMQNGWVVTMIIPGADDDFEFLCETLKEGDDILASQMITKELHQKVKRAYKYYGVESPIPEWCKNDI